MSKCKRECFVTWVTLQGRGAGGGGGLTLQKQTSKTVDPTMRGTFWMKKLE